jgi:hypothetical protein
VPWVSRRKMTHSNVGSAASSANAVSRLTHLRERLVDPKAIHEARALLAEQIGKFTLEQVSENGEVSFKANGQIDFFGEENLHAWVVPGARPVHSSPRSEFLIEVAA